MKPLDLERFEGATKGTWWACCENSEAHFVFAGEGDGPTICALKSNDPNHGEYEPMSEILTMDERRANTRLIAAAPQLLAELKALRKWRETMLDARGGSFIDDAYNTAETELNSEIQNNNRS